MGGGGGGWWGGGGGGGGGVLGGRGGVRCIPGLPEAADVACYGAGDAEVWRGGGGWLVGMSFLFGGRGRRGGGWWFFLNDCLGGGERKAGGKISNGYT